MKTKYLSFVLLVFVLTGSGCKTLYQEGRWDKMPVGVPTTNALVIKNRTSRVLRVLWNGKGKEGRIIDADLRHDMPTIVRPGQEFVVEPCSDADHENVTIRFNAVMSAGWPLGCMSEYPIRHEWTFRLGQSEKSVLLVLTSKGLK